jgi:hypothetical protein
MQAALARLTGTTQFLRLLGCFPRAIGGPRPPAHTA